jgi:hypothetical protein
MTTPEPRIRAVQTQLLLRSIEQLPAEERDAVLRGFPADRYRFECYVEGLQGCIEAALPLARARGEVRVVDRAPARGDVRYRVSWVAADPGGKGPRSAGPPSYR